MLNNTAMKFQDTDNDFTNLLNDMKEALEDFDKILEESNRADNYLRMSERNLSRAEIAYERGERYYRHQKPWGNEVQIEVTVQKISELREWVSENKRRLPAIKNQLSEVLAEVKEYEEDIRSLSSK